MQRIENQEKKLALIARMREQDIANSSKLDSYQGIIHPVSQTEHSNSSHLKSLQIRFLFCLLLFLLFAGYRFYNGANKDSLALIQSEIQKDSAHNLIDFAKDFAYTLDYEKISLK